MKLSVTVTTHWEARLAVRCRVGAIRVGEPAAGSLGAPSPRDVEAVCSAVPDLPIAVALGDLPHEPQLAALAARGAVAAGASTLTVGLRGSQTPEEAVQLLRAVQDAVAGGPPVTIIAAAYADAARLDEPGLPVAALVSAAARAGVAGCLITTAVKDRHDLLTWLDTRELATLVTAAHDQQLSLAVGGGLRLGQLGRIAAAGADEVHLRRAVATSGLSFGRLDPGQMCRARELCVGASVHSSVGGRARRRRP
ncbi:MAG: uncharacterized protein JWM31_712 [Solirubrobacterales bacterium]|nr:uncharacterized protein [Solirubrobacterales bacterium]